MIKNIDPLRPQRPRTRLLSQGVAAQADDALFNASKPLEIVDQGTFSIPGRYVKTGEHTIMVGAMYVQYQIPKNKTRPYPIVFIHGGGQTAANYLSTPDGRRGWADDFVANGYAVYLVDQPGRGRSGFFSAAYGKAADAIGRGECVSVFTDTKHAWPQDGLHTQWPGAGKPAIRPSTTSWRPAWKASATKLLSDQLNREAGAKLLDRIGPAVLLTHSQSGMVGWTIANDRPATWSEAFLRWSRAARRSAISTRRDRRTIFPMARPCVPGASRAAQWPMIHRSHRPRNSSWCGRRQPDAPDLVRCFMQAEPAHKLAAT